MDYRKDTFCKRWWWCECAAGTARPPRPHHCCSNPEPKCHKSMRGRDVDDGMAGAEEHGRTVATQWLKDMFRRSGGGAMGGGRVKEWLLHPPSSAGMRLGWCAWCYWTGLQDPRYLLLSTFLLVAFPSQTLTKMSCGYCGRGFEIHYWTSSHTQHYMTIVAGLGVRRKTCMTHDWSDSNTRWGGNRENHYSTL